MSIEKLIEAHTLALQENTVAVKELQTVWGALVDLGRANLKGKPPASAGGVALAEAPKVDEVKPKAEPKAEPEVTEQSGVPFSTVRELMIKLASAGKRDELKAINVAHGIAKLSVLLDTEDDYSTVNDQGKLEAVYADLQKLGA